jgi:hypothetical protein
LWAFTALCGLALVPLLLSTNIPGSDDPSTTAPTVAAAFVAFQAFATVGMLIATRLPRNGIGWIFLSGAVLCQWANLVGAWSEFAAGRGLPGVVWPPAIFSGAWLAGVCLIAIFGFLLFPDGALLSPAWRPVAWVGGALLGATSAGFAFSPGEIEGAASGHENPLGSEAVATIGGVSALGLLLVLLLSVTSLVLRFRRSSGVERQQLKVFVGTVCFVAVALVTLALVDGLTGIALGWVGDVIWLVLIAAVPTSVGVAILRYRLYDFDRVISRTLVYGALSVILGATYVGLVLAGQWVFSSFAGGSNLAIAASTLLVAALFLPVRSRVQRFVDRRFYRGRYDAQRTLEGFGARLREQIDLGTLERDLRGVVAETMQPAHASVWLRTGARS